MDVAIVGVGLHPFGRFGEVTGIEMGAIAIRRALADAGVEWRDIQFAFGGSYEVDNPDAVVALLGLTGIPFTDVYNGCATAASALTLAANTIRLGDSDLGIAVGMDKHIPGAFSADPRLYACPSWYGEVGQFMTTKFFGMKINKYMHDHGISHETLAKVAAKNYRNGALNPNAFRRKPLSEEEILASPMLNYPLTQYMFCSPDEGAAAVVLCKAEHAHRYTDKPIYLRATTVRTRRLGAFEVHSPWLPIEETAGATVDASRAAFEMAGIGPEDVDVIQLQDTDAGAEVIHLAENGFCADGEQEAAGRRRRARDRRPVAGEHRRRPHRERRTDRRVGPAPGARDRAATARRRGRTPGAGQPEGRLHAALRRARHRRRVDPLDVNTEPARARVPSRPVARDCRLLRRVPCAVSRADARRSVSSHERNRSRPAARPRVWHGSARVRYSRRGSPRSTRSIRSPRPSMSHAERACIRPAHRRRGRTGRREGRACPAAEDAGKGLKAIDPARYGVARASRRRLLVRHLHAGRPRVRAGAGTERTAAADGHRGRRVAVGVRAGHVLQRRAAADPGVRRLLRAQPRRRRRCRSSGRASTPTSPARSAAPPTIFRTDQDAPVLDLQTETDVGELPQLVRRAPTRQ